MPRISVVCLGAVALAVLSACGSTTAGGQSPVAAASATDSSSESDPAPPTETSGTEPARPPQDSQPSLEVASLPIGANADEGCLTIRFLASASEVPPGLRLAVTRVWFDPEAIEIGGSGCSGETPSCLDGLNLTESTSDECFAAIRTADPGAVGDQVEVEVAATVDCPQDSLPACTAFKEKLDSDEQSVGVAHIVVPAPGT
ncbi:MAG: hypothetical protein ACXV3S_11005 [Kineosporiaceae bacterium]